MGVGDKRVMDDEMHKGDQGHTIYTHTHTCTKPTHALLGMGLKKIKQVPRHTHLSNTLWSATCCFVASKGDGGGCSDAIVISVYNIKRASERERKERLGLKQSRLC